MQPSTGDVIVADATVISFSDCIPFSDVRDSSHRMIREFACYTYRTPFASCPCRPCRSGPSSRWRSGWLALADSLLGRCVVVPVPRAGPAWVWRPFAGPPSLPPPSPPFSLPFFLFPPVLHYIQVYVKAVLAPSSQARKGTCLHRAYCLPTRTNTFSRLSPNFLRCH